MSAGRLWAGRTLTALPVLFLLFDGVIKLLNLGAILLTAFLGGATATHLRVGDPLLTHVFFPVYVGLMMWGGLFLREGRLPALVPLRQRIAH